MGATATTVAGGGVEPCPPADELFVVVGVEALLLGCPGAAKVTKLEPMSGRFPLAL